MSTTLESLQWRYATKKFDAARKLSREQLDGLLETLRLAPSSYGLQPYKFIVVENVELRAKIREAAWNQTQVTDASHLIAICSRKVVDEAYVDGFVSFIASERGMPVDALKSYRDMMVGSLKNRTPEQIAEWARRQAYITLGFVLAVAAQMGIDSCPMEGFDAAKVDELLGLAKDGLGIVALCPVGFRASDDAYAGLKKVRLGRDRIIEARA